MPFGAGTATLNNQAHQNYGQMPPVLFQNGASENDSNSFSNRLADPLGSRLDNLDRTDQIGVSHDLAAVDSGRNDGDLLPDDSDGQTDGGLSGRVDQMETGFQNSESGILGSLPAGGIPSTEISNLDNRDDCEVKNGRTGNGSQIKESDDQNKCNAVGDVVAGSSGNVSDSGMEAISGDSRINSDDCELDCQKDSITQSARIKSPANQASFDAGTLVFGTQKTLVADLPQIQEIESQNAEKKHAESIAIEPLKSSKFGWLIRLRLNSLPGRPAVPVTYKTDAEYRALRRSKKRYEQYKKSLKAEYQASLRKGE